MYVALNEKGSFLSLGERDGQKDFTDETIVIDWGDGTQDSFAFSNSCKFKSDGTPEVKRSFHMNGKASTTSGFFVRK